MKYESSASLCSMDQFPSKGKEKDDDDDVPGV